MTYSENLGPQFTKSGKKRHKMVKFVDRSGVNIGCEHCDDFKIKHPTKVDRSGPVSSWHHTDKTGMKEAWEAHKAENQ